MFPPLRVILVIGSVFFALFLIKVYIYKRFLKDSTFFKNRRFLAISFLIMLSLAELGLFVIRDTKLTYTQYIFIGSGVAITYCLFLACLIGDIIKMAYQLTQKSLHTQNYTTNFARRKFFKIAFDLGVVCLFFLFSVKGFASALKIPPIREIKIKLPKLKTNKTIAMITDIHVGKALGGAFLLGLVEKINTLKADIVVIVGDLVDDKIENVTEDLKALNKLQSKEGTYYVAGNHEYYNGAESIFEFLQTLDITILHNKNIELDAFNLAGVSDLAGMRFNYLKPDLDSAQNNLNINKPSILLAHQPKFVRQNDVSAFDLVLSGHTHAGQVFPMSFFVWLDQHYIYGLYDISPKTKLYVSSGAGFWGPAIRFLAPSEIALLKLEA